MRVVVTVGEPTDATHNGDSTRDVTVAVVSALARRLHSREPTSQSVVEAWIRTTNTQCAEAVVDTTQLCTQGVTVVSCSDTTALITRLRAESSIDIFIHTAPVPEITQILRSTCPKCAIVVFSQCNHMEWHETVTNAMTQNRVARLNMTVCMDIRDDCATFVTAEGGIMGPFKEAAPIATALSTFVLKRWEVLWFETVIDGTNLPEHLDSSRFTALLKFAQSSHLLFNNSGNVSALCGPDYFRVTPRQVDKSVVSPDQCPLVRVDLPTRRVCNFSKVTLLKSSIDSGVQQLLYKRYPHITQFLHFHQPWGKFTKSTQFPFPCGTVEEATEIESAVGNCTAGDFAVHLVHHGALLGLTDSAIPRLEHQWQTVNAEFDKHLTDIGNPDTYSKAEVRRPVFSDTDIVGLVLELQDIRRVGIFLGTASRGAGIGRYVTQQVASRHLAIRTYEQCGVVSYYRSLGFLMFQHPVLKYYDLTPPTSLQHQQYNEQSLMSLLLQSP
ncbi:hypothetical protein Pelo_16732 [Pelomyxa schiedti]|nr:hypothetical protein Pelo_16732 [Pelomyxa schiedti]